MHMHPIAEVLYFLRWCTVWPVFPRGHSTVLILPLLMDIQVAPELLILQTRPSRLCAHV